jgi:hypothetical protein
MSADEFWKDDPQLFVSYRTSFINKSKRKMEEYDYLGWLFGLYNYDGNSKLNAQLRQTIGNMFAKSPNNTKIDGYVKKPYTELEKEEKNKKIDKYENYQNSLIYFGSLKKVYTERLLNKNKKGD